MSVLDRLSSIMRVRPFDTGSERGRAYERYRRAGFTSAVAIAAKAVAVVAVLLTVPLTLDYLGSESYGLWLTLSSVALVFGFSDLGLGNGVLNAVAEAHGRDDSEAARQAVSSGLAMLSATGASLFGVFLLAYPLVSWAGVFNVTSPQAVMEAGPSTFVYVLVWALSIPAGVVERTQLGYQRGFVTYAWQAGGAVLSLVGALTVIASGRSMPWVVLALAGGPLVALVGNGLFEFVWARPWLRPALSSVTRSSARRVARLGVLFFVLQLTYVTTYFSDNLIVAQVLGSAEVTQYAVPAKLFALIGTVLATVVWSLWPAYSEALVRGDIAWVRRTLMRSLVLTLVMTAVPAAVLVVIGRPLIEAWVGGSVDPSLSLLSGLGAWAVVSGLGGAVAIFLNGLSVLRFQVVCGAFMFALALALKIEFARAWGVAGVPWAAVVAYITCVGAPMVIYVPRLVRRMTSGIGIEQART